MREDGYLNYREWVEHTVRKIVSVGLSIEERHRADWFDVQIHDALAQALRHGRSGRADDEDVAP